MVTTASHYCLQILTLVELALKNTVALGNPHEFQRKSPEQGTKQRNHSKKPPEPRRNNSTCNWLDLRESDCAAYSRHCDLFRDSDKRVAAAFVQAPHLSQQCRWHLD